MNKCKTHSCDGPVAYEGAEYCDVCGLEAESAELDNQGYYADCGLDTNGERYAWDH